MWYIQIISELIECELILLNCKSSSELSSIKHNLLASQSSQTAADDITYNNIPVSLTQHILLEYLQLCHYLVNPESLNLTWKKKFIFLW